MISLSFPPTTKAGPAGTIADIRPPWPGCRNSRDFEIIVVNDHSEDDTFGVVAALAGRASPACA
jgi:hypothetical protein